MNCLAVLIILFWTGFGHGLPVCENAKSESLCASHVRESLRMILKSPEKFPGLHRNATYSDLQSYFYDAKLYQCPRACLAQEEPCLTFGPTYPGMKSVIWVRTTALPQHPDWYPDLSPASSMKDIAKALYMRGHEKTPRVCEDGEEEGHFVPAETACQNGGPDSQCARKVLDAMSRDFARDPSSFVGLNLSSSFSDFQAYFHNAGMHHCPRPCLPQEQPCTTFNSFYHGMGDIMWVRTHGMLEHPEWYPDLWAKSSNKDIAKALYMRGAPCCKRVCEDGEEEGHFVPASKGSILLSEDWMQKRAAKAYPGAPAPRAKKEAQIHIKKRKLPDQGMQQEGWWKVMLSYPWWTGLVAGLAILATGATWAFRSPITESESSKPIRKTSVRNAYRRMVSI